MKFNKNVIKGLTKIMAVIAGVAMAGGASAAVSAIALTELQTNLGHTVGNLAVMLTDISIVAGVGFVMASFFKFHQHKLNPTQVPISQGITLLLVGAGLLLFPVMLPTATKAAFGTTAIGKTSGGAIKGLISG
jgi:intracellular multiplication protein IcmD